MARTKIKNKQQQAIVLFSFKTKASARQRRITERGCDVVDSSITGQTVADVIVLVALRSRWINSFQLSMGQLISYRIKSIKI